MPPAWHGTREDRISGELAAPGDRNDLRVTARAFARGHLSSCPTGSFRDGLGGRTRQSIQRRFHQRGHVHIYLYSKLPETGVSPHIGTGGREVGSVPDYRVYFIGRDGHEVEVWERTRFVRRLSDPTSKL